ncbi:carbohydrate ABC transporter permease [Nonomuraea basaltis]|uniref:carbohydrate ABC transporter permease n=1 Tax=Nonomuraea basaltis TaxID=2495887 RepID=UPI00110C60AA|nr:sugar ABC transporter permease [Nonomuraea basaltis]TMR98621.1 sugar ABC transporter permease [Nonomuraea basaltis]
MTSPNQPKPTYRAIGWLLAVPALLGTLITLVLPTAQTIWFSLQSGGVFKESTFVGTANYLKLLGDELFWQALGFTFSLTVIPLLVAVVVGPLLALALDRAGTWPRRAGRIVLSLAIVTFSPVGVAAAWLYWLTPDASGVSALAEGLRAPDTAPGVLRLIVAAATFGVVCALAVTAFLPALRGGTVRPAMFVVGALVALATVAVGLQTFSIGLVLTRGGPERSTETLAGLQFDYAFRLAKFGSGASVAALTGVILGVLGVAATLIAVLSRMRITLTRASAPSGSVPPGAVPPSGSASAGSSRQPTAAGVVVGVSALVIFVAAGALLAWPWIFGVLTSPGTAAAGLQTQVNTWVPAVAGAFVSVGVAYLAALGIGGLRPLGRGSEWLLLLFAPWLFVSTGPLGVANWQNMRNLGLINTFVALFPPLLVSVPALFVLTLLCKGLAERNGRDFFSGVVMPSLPMAGILTGAVALVNAQDLLWPLLIAQEPAMFTAPLAQMNQLGGYATGAPDVGAATPLLVVAVALVAVVAAQVLYLDRLAVTTNGSRSRTPAA